MKTSIILLVLAIFIPIGSLLSQTGPGGIGSSATNRFWVDASTISLANGASILNMTESSGNGFIGLPNTSTSRPIFRTNQLNGFPAIDFDGINDNLRFASVTGLNSQPITWFIVGNVNVLTRSQVLLHFAHSGTPQHANLRYTLFYLPTNQLFSSSLNNLNQGLVARHTRTTSAQILSTVISNTTATAFTNSTQTGTFTTTFLSPTGNNLRIALGHRSNLNDMHLDGNISEAIVFNFELNSIQRTMVENYLSSKYALAIAPANDHYAMEGSGHYFTVSGIGMEGGNSVTNAEGRSLVQINAASALANGDYLLWGHNNASLTVNTTNVPSQFAPFTGSRLNRTWRVDETGDVGTYTLAINMATMPALGASTADYVLMIDDDGDFSNGGSTYHTTGYSFVGNTATWTGVDIPDGSYFTVAYVPAIFSITSGAWNDNTTWNCDCIPTNSDNVFISANDAVNVDGFAETNNFTIVPTATLDFSGLNQLAVSGDFDNQGTFIGASGRLTMNGGAAQFMNSNSAIAFEEFEVNNSSGVTIQTGDYTISSIGTYFPTEGDLDVSGANSFLFDSDVAGTGRIDQFTATSSITGSVTYRRFIAAGTGGYRDLATPLLGGSTVSAFDDDMFISGPTTSGFADGCAGGSGGCFYSFKFYVANAYSNITTAGTTIPNATRGVHAWVSDSYPNGLASPVIIDLTGPVGGAGNIVASATGTNTFTTIGNPYLSQIDFDELDRSNMGDFYYVWDVNINNYNWYQIGNGSSPLTNILASGQGFVVMPETNFGTITFEQADKTSNPATFIRTETSKDFFRLALNRMNADKKYSCDVTFNINTEANNGFDRFDIPTPLGIDPDAIYMSAKADDKNVRCFGMNNKETTISVPLILNVPALGDYSINTKNLEIFDHYTCVVLEDMETGSRYNLRNINEVRFTIEKINQDDARFMIHFSNDACDQMVAGIDINDNESMVEMTNFNEYVKVDMKFESSENVTISFFNMLGQNVLSEQHNNVSSKSVNVNVPSSLKNGVYLVVVETDEKRYTRKYNF